MTKIIIVRHGFSTSNKDGTFTGQMDAPLSDVGKKQAELVCEYIKNHYTVDEFYSSDLTRAVDTIKEVADYFGKSIHLEKGLREVDCGEWTGKKVDQVKDEFFEDFTRWKKGGEDSPMTGGESMRQVKERAMAVIDRIVKDCPNKTVVVATHGGLIKTIQSGCLKIPYESLSSGWATNASITEFNYDGEKFTLEKFSFDEYLGELTTTMPSGV